MVSAAPSTTAPVLCDNLVLAVTGSPACLSMPQYVVMLRQALVGSLTVMMTASAQMFVTPYTMRLHAGGWVYTDLNEIVGDTIVPHIDITESADLMLVMPATANIIAKAAAGICDDLVSTSIVACPAPVALVPAMNERMWRSKVVQHNVGRVRELGYHVIEPGAGLQISNMEDGAGLMPPLEHILGDLIALVPGPRPAVAS